MLVRNQCAPSDVKHAAHQLVGELGTLARFFSRTDDTVAMTGLQDARLLKHLALLDANARLLAMEVAVKVTLAGTARLAIVVESARLRVVLRRLDAKRTLQEHDEDGKETTHDIEARSWAVLKEIEVRLTILGIETGQVI